MTVYRLGSSGMIHTPGIVRWAINGYHFSKDRKHMLEVMTASYPGLPVEAAKALLSGKAPYTVEDETVIFEVAA